MTQIMAILNLTPDSFSDGHHGQSLSLPELLQQVEQMIEHGAGIIDIGAESTRPGATPLNAAEEWQRLEPILPELIQAIHQQGAKVSIDTRHAETVARALTLGVDIINDVSAARNAALLQHIAASTCDYVLMHSLSVPAEKDQVMDNDSDVVSELLSWFDAKIKKLQAIGIDQSRIILDPGIGFGKTATQSWQIIRAIDQIKSLKQRVLLGHSRKSFLAGAGMVQRAAQDRDVETAVISAYAAQQHIDYVRVHQVDINARAIQVALQLGEMTW